MAASLKDVLKAVGGAFASPQISHDIPTTLQDSIQLFLDSEPLIDDVTSQRAQDELSNIFRKSVAPSQARSSAFLQILDLFSAFITAESQKLYWYKALINPILDDVGRLRLEIERASNLMLTFLDYEADEDRDGSKAKSSQFLAKALLNSYCTKSNYALDEKADFVLDNEHTASHFQKILLSYGRRKPKDLMIALDESLLNKTCRIQSLALVTMLISEQPPHLHQVSRTSLIEHLLQCLMIDTSTPVIQLALTAMVMFLPHIPNTARTHLPRLFLIYSRLLCWDQIPKLPPEHPPMDATHHRESTDDFEDADDGDTNGNLQPGPEEGWQKVFGTQDLEESDSLDLIHFFTFLYGLYPLNFTAFIRKPRRYLKDIKFPRAEQLDLDQDLIRSRTDAFRQRHLMHPNFYLTTAEDELEDDRFATLDASDAVAQCISLVSVSPDDVTKRGPPVETMILNAKSHPGTGAQDDIPSDSLLAADEEALVTADGIPSDKDGALSMILPDNPGSSRSDTSRTRTFFDQTQADRAPSLATTRTKSPDLNEAPNFAPSLGIDPPKASQAALLRRQVLALRNELTYERYLKQQHLSHIGQLQRRHVVDATLSASVENLLSLNKSLRSKLSKANDAYHVLKKETATGRAQSKEFEVKLSSRVRTLRDAEKDWIRERNELQLELSRLRNDGDTLRQLVVDSEARELLSKQKVATMDFELERAKEMEKLQSGLQERLREQECKAWSHEQSATRHEAALMELEALKMQMASQRAEAESMRQIYDRRVESLESQIESGRDVSERSPKMLETIDKANRAANARYWQLKREYAVLKEENAQLELRVQDWESEAGGPSIDANSRVGRRAGAAPIAQHAQSLGGVSQGPVLPSAVLSHISPTLDEDGSHSAARTSAPAKTNTTTDLLDTVHGIPGQAEQDASFYEQEESPLSADSLDDGTPGASGRSSRFGSKTNVSRSVIGRVGSSNTSKDADKKKKKAAQSKIAGIRGIRGIM